MPIELDLEPGRRAKLSVSKDGASVALRCREKETCAVLAVP
jgi:hypothetical protein